jgi:CO/xanthine dehydrogenase Mo-binding subunit
MSRDAGATPHDPHGGDGHGTRPPPDAGTLESLARPEERIEGRLKVTGRAQYAADRTLPGTLHARFLVCPMPHARIRSIDATAARAMPGVHAVLTGEDLRGVRHGRRLMDRPVLAWDRALFVGDRIAAVAADTVAQAEAAVGSIELELEQLPSVLDVDAALAPDAPILHPPDDAAGYHFFDGPRKAPAHPNIQGVNRVRRGEADLEPLFASAALVVEQTFRTPRQHHGYIEPHATTAWVDDAGVVHVITTNKNPFGLRKQLVATYGLSNDTVEIHAEFIGGDFGGKGYGVDEFIVVALARATGRPVRAVARYTEDVGELNPRHAATMRLRTAVGADGELLAHEADIRLEGGAYAAAKPLPSLSLSGGIATLVPYRCPNVRIDATTFYTNTVPGGHMRAPGEVQALFAGESHLDEIARRLGEDPLAFRRRIAVRDGETSATGSTFIETKGVQVLDALGEAIDWARPRPPGRGVGVALGARHVGGGKLPLRMLVHNDGGLEVTTGLPDQGSGSYDVIRRVLAVSASVDPARIRVTHRTTSAAPFDPGVGGSRVTHLSSRAAEGLGVQLRAWLDERLPAALPSAPQGATLRDDRFVDAETGTDLGSYGEVVARLVQAGEPVLLSETFEAAVHGPDEGGDYDFGGCAVEVEVDPETGTVRVTDAVLVADVGTVINPVAHLGQLVGGFAMGFGAGIMEGLEVEDGAITTLSLADMKIPTSGDMPPLRVVQIPTLVGPGAFGAKAAGELTNAPVAPAIANAVADAVGVRITEMPISAERVLAALQAAGAGGAETGAQSQSVIDPPAPTE